MPSFLIRQLRALAPVFRPPFDGLWLAVLLYFFWCFLVYPKSQLLRGNLPDPDDYMYLDQVLDWLNGQGWFDPVQHRLDPPVGGLIHFSRLAQIPMAAIVWLFECVGVPPVGAATLMAVIEPLLLFAGFFWAIRWVAECFVPKNWSGASAFVAMFATGLLAMFAPGHVDHHGLVVLIIILALGCALRMMREPFDLHWAAASGFALALSLSVALEVLPWLIVFSGWIGLWATVKGRATTRSGFVFGLTLYAGSVLFLLLTKPVRELLVPDVAAYSIVYVFFTGSIATVFGGIFLAAEKPQFVRWLLAGGISLATGTLFLVHFPDLLTGPWGGVNPALAELILDNVNEAKPYFLIKGSVLGTLTGMLEPLASLGAGLYFMKRARGSNRWAWGLVMSLLAAALGLSVFYQYRFIGMLGAFAIVPLTALLFNGWQWIGRQWHGRPKTLAEIALLLLVGPLPAVLLPAAIDGRSFNKGVLLFPVHSDEAGICDMYGLEKVLKAPQLYGGRPRIIMNTMGIGPELLLRTPHAVLSAPYHEVVTGNLDAVRFFAATDPVWAESIARRWRAELVVACKLVPGMYTDLAAIKRALPDMAEKGAAKAEPPMILRLITGQMLPDWLVPVTSPGISNYVVYEIVRPKGRSQKSPERE